MSLVKPLIVSALIIFAMLAVSALAWPHIPDAPVAVHFNASGEANGYASRIMAALIMPGLSVCLTALLAVLPPLMPRGARLERSSGPYAVVWLGLLALLMVLHAMLMARAVGIEVSVPRVATVSAGLVLALIGNFMGKVRYNYLFGIRTPWTLSSERVWDRTHRFTGRWMVLGGLIAVVCGLALPNALEAWLPKVLIASALIPALLGTAYSFVEDRRVEGGA